MRVCLTVEGRDEKCFAHILILNSMRGTVVSTYHSCGARHDACSHFDSLLSTNDYKATGEDAHL